jgi:hypothetical protein
MAIKYNNIFYSQGPPNFTKFGIFGLKANHLATLVNTPLRIQTQIPLLSVHPTLSSPTHVPDAHIESAVQKLPGRRNLGQIQRNWKSLKSGADSTEL